MENHLVYLVLFLLGLFGCGYFIIKIVEWQSTIKKYPTNKAEFVHDLYRIQNKWLKKGEYTYSQSIQLIIMAVNQEAEAQTEEGKELQKKMKFDINEA